jgi:hypothetical protein
MFKVIRIASDEARMSENHLLRFCSLLPLISDRTVFILRGNHARHMGASNDPSILSVYRRPTFTGVGGGWQIAFLWLSVFIPMQKLCAA